MDLASAGISLTVIDSIMALPRLQGRFMLMFYRNLWVLALLALTACSPAGDEPAAAAPATGAEREVMPSWREDYLALGKETYERVCASCHESGEQGAPVTGKREQWEGRSDLWQAVLFEHAKSGYLDMPGRGGQPDLSDEAVEAAAEYMLGLTYPELPTD
jgi:cytochrome c5